MDENPKGNALLQEILPGSVRILMQTRRRGRGHSYVPVAGFSRPVEVRTLSEAQRLWQVITDVIEGGGWHDGAPSARVGRGRRRAAAADNSEQQSEPALTE